MSATVVLTHTGLKRDITVAPSQAKAILAGQKAKAEKRKAAGEEAVAGEWKPKKAGDA